MIILWILLIFILFTVYMLLRTKYVADYLHDRVVLGWLPDHEGVGEVFSEILWKFWVWPLTKFDAITPPTEPDDAA